MRCVCGLSWPEVFRIGWQADLRPFGPGWLQFPSTGSPGLPRWPGREQYRLRQ